MPFKNRPRPRCGTRAGREPAAPPLPATDIVWFDDAPPAGATTSQAWQWDAAEKVSGTHSFRDARNEYAHSFWFTTTMPLTVSSDDTIFTWVRLDPCDPPQEILLEFFDGSGWEHRAFWGTANILQGGAPNTAAHRRMGAMPPAGEWVRLEIPASLVGVSNVYGMRFVLSDGHAWWDRVGHAPSQQALAASGAHLTRADAAPRGRRRGWWARLLPVGKSEEAPINMSLGASYVSDSSTERRYSIYSPALQLLAETATTSASAPPIANEYIWFGGEPLAQVETTTGAASGEADDHFGGDADAVTLVVGDEDLDGADQRPDCLGTGLRDSEGVAVGCRREARDTIFTSARGTPAQSVRAGTCPSP